jgi:aromatic ring-opening dioxygenase catalytic subunit (LigB family)
MMDTQGWDHGVFVPMGIINPKASIPIIQMSILPTHSETDSTARLFKTGTALAQLRDRNIAIVGSGLYTFHNLQGFRTPRWRRGKEALIQQWSEGLTAAVMVESQKEREEALGKWRMLPGSEICHPRGAADHLFPLFVCAGAAGEGVGRTWVDSAMGEELVSYYWE